MPVEDVTRAVVARLLESARRSQQRAWTETEARRAVLPLHYLRQQAHLTAPAADPALARKALAGAHLVAARLLERYGIDARTVGDRLGVDVGVVEGLMAGGEAPVVVLDLEDGVAPSMVDEARGNAVRAARETDRGRTLCYVRPAGVGDPRCAEDLVTLLVGAAGDGAPAGEGAPAAYPLDGIVLPKVRHVHEVLWLDSVLGEVEDAIGLPRHRIRVSFLVETGWGVLNLPELAAAGRERLSGIILGTVDLSADLLVPEVRYRHPVAEWARMMIVTVAGAMGVPAIDGMTLDFPVGSPDRTPAENRELVLDRMAANFEDARHSIDIGMSGRWVGHPLQLLATLLAFRSAHTPAAIEAQVARLEEFSRATGAGVAAVAGASGELLDLGTDRHVRSLLRRAAAWGMLAPGRAYELGLISAAERDGALR